MKRALVVALVLAGTVALADDRADLRAIEHDVASTDSTVRAAAFVKAEGLRDSSAKVRLLCKAAEDPDPGIQKRGRDKLLNLDPRDARHLRADRLAGPLLKTPGEKDQLQLIQVIENGLESGARFPPGPLLAVAVRAKDPELKERCLKAASQAVEVAPIVSSDLGPLGRLLADPQTRAAALDMVLRSEGPTATRLLIELEAVDANARERERVKDALDARAAGEDFAATLEDIAKNASDERVREAAKKRLGSR